LKRFHLRTVIVLLGVCLPITACASTTPLLVDNFDSDATGSIPAGWTLAKTVAGTHAKVVDGTPPGNKWVEVHDDNAPGTTTNNTLSRTFTPVTAETGSGRVTAQFDVNLSQITAGFGTRLTNGGVATSGANWATALLFEGNIAYASGASPGNLSYQTTTSVYTLTPLRSTYSASTWHTVRVEANVGTRSYRIFFGPRGGTLTEITPSGGVPFITTGTGGQVDRIGGISFYTSIKDGDTAGDLMIDNVNIYIDEPEQVVQAGTIAEARLLERGTKVSLTNKIVTAGAAGGVFYIEDDTPGAECAAGIRVRSLAGVLEGDRVDVVGRIAQTSEGNPSAHNGEREISAEQITVNSSGNAVPKPLFMRSADLGAGWFGPMELLSEGLEPAVKGIWPHNAWGNDGVTKWLPEDNRMFPLHNVGLLVTVTGRVSETTAYDMYGTNYDFFIDDGSLTNDGWFAAPTYEDEAFHPRGLRVRITDPNILSQAIQDAPLHYGDFVKVTGIAGAISCSDLGRSSIRNVRVIRPRKPEDVEVMQRAETRVRFDAQGNALVAGVPFFPIGIFIYAWDSITRPEILSKGFNTVIYAVTPSDLPQLQADGLMTIPYAKDEWLAVKENPQILAWYLDDEPEGHGISPKTEREYYERVREADPTRPIGTAHFLWDSLYNYRFCDDYTMSDVYPIHGQALTAVTDHIDRLHAIHGPGFPVWPAIQCFGGTEGYDIPSPAEVRVMTYMALAHNSKGILYFSYYPSIPDTWAEVGTLVSELKQLTPFLCQPSTEVPLGNSNGAIHTRCIRMGNSGLIITANVTGEAQTATLTITDSPPESLTLPFEGGTVTLTNGSFTASFAPLGVHVYQWGPTPTL